MIAPIVEWNSRFNMEEGLRHLDKESVFLGADTENPRKFHSIELSGYLPPVVLAIISSGWGIDPSAIILASKKVALVGSKKVALVGYDNLVSGVNLDTRKISFTKHLVGPFYEFLTDQSHDSALAVHELGLVRVRFDGHIIWEIDTPLVVSCRRKDNRLILITDDKVERTISADTGTLEDTRSLPE